jgi:hypothetical protein
MSEPIREPGWYRIVAWESVPEDEAKAEIEAGEGHNLIFIENPGPGRKYQMSPE